MLYWDTAGSLNQQRHFRHPGHKLEIKKANLGNTAAAATHGAWLPTTSASTASPNASCHMKPPRSGFYVFMYHPSDRKHTDPNPVKHVGKTVLNSIQWLWDGSTFQLIAFLPWNNRKDVSVHPSIHPRGRGFSSATPQRRGSGDLLPEWKCNI